MSEQQDCAPDEGSVLDRRTLNRTLLARQLLLERAGLPALQAVEQLVGMQAQVPLDPYVGLWSRLRDFDPTAFGEELLERRLVRMTLMRTTLHLATARDAVRLRPVLEPVIERAFASSPFARNLAGLDLGPVLSHGTAVLEREPLTPAALAAALAERWPANDPTSLGYAVRYLVPLVQVTPRGVWGQALQPTLTTLRRWLGPLAGPRMDVEELVLRYLRAFGPASPADVRTWSGLDVRPAIARLRTELRAYRDEAGRTLHDVRDGSFADPSAPAPVRFLPQYDNAFLSHADRSRIADRVRWGSSFVGRGSLLVDGLLAGAWRRSRSRDGEKLSVELRTRVSPAELRAVRAEAGALLSFLAPDARSRKLEVR